MQEQEFGFVEHVHIEFFVGLSFFFGDFLFTVCSSVVNLGQQVPCPAAGIVSFQYLWKVCWSFSCDRPVVPYTV